MSIIKGLGYLAAGTVEVGASVVGVVIAGGLLFGYINRRAWSGR